MSPYDEQLEELLLQKSYPELNSLEKARVDRVLGGGEEAYAATRALRLRSRSTLQGEAAPADPGGLAAVMARTSVQNRRRIPLWQAVAAVLLAVAGTWMASSLTQKPSNPFKGLLAASDTVWQEIRVVDTVYLPAPQARNHPVTQAKPSGPRMEYKGRPVELGSEAKARLEAAVASLPDPETMGKSGGGAGTRFRPKAVETVTDNLLSEK